MPFTPLKGYSIQTGGTNTGTWGAGVTTPANADLNNGVMLVMDNNLAGISSISLSSSNYTLTATDIQNSCHRFSGSLLANITVSPGSSTLYNGFYFWENTCTGNFSLTITPLAGASVVLPQNRRGVLFIDTGGGSPNGARIMSISTIGAGAADAIPAGTLMPFYNAAVPTGWNLNTSLDDYAFRLSGSAGGSTGGVQAFSTVFNFYTPSGNVSAPTVFVSNSGWPDGGNNGGSRGFLVVASGNPGQTFGGAGFVTNNGQTFTCSTPGFSGNAADFRVRYANLILGNKQ